MTGPVDVTVRMILVDAVLWWYEGRLNAEPGPALAMFTPNQQARLYDLVDAEARNGCGDAHLDWLMGHLAHEGGNYLTPDGTIVEANRPPDSPEVPRSLLEVARELYATTVQVG